MHLQRSFQQKKSLLILVLIFLISANKIFAENEISVQNSSKEDFWISFGADAGLYSSNSISFGGGFSIGYGTGSSFGFKAAWYFSPEGMDTLELSLILRFYLFGKDAYSGPFLQFIGGPVLFNNEGNFTIPADSGAMSAGLIAGWRFICNDKWFVEPAIRGGYPYLFTAGVSAGIRL